MKTPEELCKEWCKENLDIATHAYCYGAVNLSFLAGYQAAAPQWISVKDRLPEVGERVLIYVPATDGDCDHWIADFQMQGKWQMFGYNATHWMPLPAAPKEEA
jgi:hypothetical protein